MKKIRVGIVNYLNTKPLIYGLQMPPIADKIELIGAYPAKLADMLANDEIDIGLVPVASIPHLPVHNIIGNYCIAAEGEIASVCLFSEVPIDQIKRVYLDYQSRSSAALLKWLMKEYWGSNADLIETKDESFREKIKGDSAGLVIGDRALEQRKISTFIYDLGSEWRAITGLPFVFAAWVSNKDLPAEFILEFDQANSLGLHHINSIVDDIDFQLYDLRKYYTLHLSYHLNERARKGMDLFLKYITEK